MNQKEAQQTLIAEIAAILTVDASEISPDALLHDLGIDSLSFVELLVVIEKTFNLKLMETGLTREDFQTINSLAACISKLC
jgi:acyl carrier protein